VKVILKQASVCTELNIVQEGTLVVVPLGAGYLSWKESLTLLEKPVKAEIPD
jgi:hypothetical protein